MWEQNNDLHPSIIALVASMVVPFWPHCPPPAAHPLQDVPHIMTCS